MEYHACKRDWVAKVVSLIQMLLTFRRRAVSYFSLQGYCTRNPSTRLVLIPYCNITSWSAIALAEIIER